MQVTNNTQLVRNNPFTKERILKKVFQHSEREDKIVFRLVCKQWAQMLSAEDLRTTKRKVFETPEVFENIFKYFNTEELCNLQKVCKVFDTNICTIELKGNLDLFEKYKKEYLRKIPITKYITPHLKGIYEKPLNKQYVVGSSMIFSSTVAMVTGAIQIICNKGNTFYKTAESFIPPLDLSKTFPNESLKNLGNVPVPKYYKTMKTIIGEYAVRLSEEHAPDGLRYKIFHNDKNILLGATTLIAITALAYKKQDLMNYFFSHTSATKNLVQDKVKITLEKTMLEKFNINPILLPKFPVFCRCDMDKEEHSDSFYTNTKGIQRGNNKGHILNLDEAKQNLAAKKCSYKDLKINKKHLIPLVAYLSFQDRKIYEELTIKD